jgi:hypothetical protein
MSGQAPWRGVDYPPKLACGIAEHLLLIICAASFPLRATETLKIVVRRRRGDALRIAQLS